MDPATIGARLASSAVAPLIKKLFVAEGPGAGLADRPVRISARVSFTGEKRTLTERDVRRLAAELVRRAVAARDGREPAVPEDEEEAVTHALARTLHALGDLDMTDVQAVELGHEALARRLRAAAGNPDLLLSADATLLYERLLELAALHILHFFTQRSTFVARSLVEQTRRQAELVAKVDELIARTPRPDGGDAAFEERYAAYIADRHSTLTIVGVDLSRAEASWPLDAAYLSLEAAAREDDFADLDRVARADIHGPSPADQALSGHDRVLLRGAAGSGKTTLVQWLAVSTARQRLPEGMEQLRGRVPFVMPLRSIIRAGTLPTPDGFLSAVHNPLHSAQPGGWADRVLRAGRGLLLVDGIDEIPERERERTRRWLADLLIAYPGNLWLVTSRPSAVEDSWLAAEGFTELTLSPMSRDDVAAFVDRWHDAARTTCRTDAERADLDTYQSRLHTAVRTKQDLNRLVTNPLMCGLVCALHRARHGYLPPGRKELYDAALTMLLTRRDTEREIHTPDDIQLTEEPQIQLLQRLAYWLIRNGRTELDRDHAERVIAEALPAVPAAVAQGDAPRIFRHLLLRSGLLREPAAGTVDFVHRTFQDYLGAKAAVEAWDIGLLINNAHDTQWEDVIRMAVAHARPRERAELLEKLVERGTTPDEPEPVRARLHLLAMACLEHATELDPRVRTLVEEHTAALIPPRTPAQSQKLAAVGPLVLELLPGPEGLTDVEAEAVTVTASLIGTDAAIAHLGRFRDHPALPVRSQLAVSWRRFDTARYFEEVVSHLPPDGLYFVADTREQLRTLHEAGGRPLMMLRGDFTPEELLRFLAPDRLTHLRLDMNRELTDLDVLGAFQELRALTLITCPRVTDLSPLSSLPLLHSLDVVQVRGGLIPPGLENLTSLRQLKIPLSALGKDAPSLRLPDLTWLTLTMGREKADLGWIERAFPRLAHLRLEVSGMAPSSHLDLSPLAALAHLRTAVIKGINVVGEDRLTCDVTTYPVLGRRTGLPAEPLTP